MDTLFFYIWFILIWCSSPPHSHKANGNMSSVKPQSCKTLIFSSVPTQTEGDAGTSVAIRCVKCGTKLVCLRVCTIKSASANMHENGAPICKDCAEPSWGIWKPRRGVHARALHCLEEKDLYILYYTTSAESRDSLGSVAEEGFCNKPRHIGVQQAWR